MTNEEKSKAQLEALLEKGEPVKIGHKEYRIYPLSLEKIEALSGEFVDILDLVQMLQGFSLDKALESHGLIKSKIDKIVELVWLLCQPNAEDAYALVTDECRQKFRRLLTIPKIIEIFGMLAKMADFQALLKNVISLGMNRISPGADLSQQSSSSLAGQSRESLGEPL